MAKYALYARDASLARVAQIGDYQRAELVLRFNAPGTWLLDMDARASGASELLQDGAGLVVVRDDASVVLSGPVTRRERNQENEQNRLLVAGADDNAWLERRLASPQPSTSAPPYNSQAYDVRTGQASTILRQYVDVNIGPSALSVRRITGLTLAADPALGSTVTGQGRWQPLLELLQELALAGGGLGFRLRQSGSDLEFSVYQPADRTASVKFSFELGNLAALKWSEEAAETNYVFCGGGGEGTSRTIREGQDSTSIVEWGRVESFRDRRDTTDSGQLDQAITEELERGAGPTGLSIVPIDLPQMAYGTHYDLGDRVTAVVDGEPIQEVIRELKILLTPAEGVQVIPTIASPARGPSLSLFDRLRRNDRLHQAERRLTNLERR